MSAPTSAQPLPKQTPNTSAPIVDLDVTTPKEGATLHISGLVTPAWRYLFGLFALTTPKIDPNWTVSVSNPPTQAQVQAIAAQVKLLSAALGRSM